MSRRSHAGVADDPAAGGPRETLVSGPLVLRVANAGMGLVVAVFGLNVVAAVSEDVVPLDDVHFALLAVFPVAAAVWLAVRALRLGVVFGPETLVVRGLLWSRVIPRAAVSEVSRDPSGEGLAPAVSWRDARGRRRWTPLVAFWATNTIRPVTRQAAEGLRRVHVHCGLRS